VADQPTTGKWPFTQRDENIALVSACLEMHQTPLLHDHRESLIKAASTGELVTVKRMLKASGFDMTTWDVLVTLIVTNPDRQWVLKEGAGPVPSHLSNLDM
jgi:hypothetical protein